jgi:hypothetical protein
MFDGNNGANPVGSLLLDASGNLYGTAAGGGSSCAAYGSSGCGIVFELTPSPNGMWTDSTLYSFTGGNDGMAPNSGLVRDSQGNLYGETSASGGSQICAGGGCGTVFRLTPSPNGTWTEKIVYSFTGTDGVEPVGGLTFDAAGNLYGVAFYGGNIDGCGCGTVFGLSPTLSGQWTETTLHVFGGGDDANPWGSLVFDPQGNLYGTATDNSTGFNGEVFELSPVAGGGWSHNVIYALGQGNPTNSSEGVWPFAGLTIDARGNLYGTSYGGGIADEGLVFMLTPGAGGAWTFSVIYNFQGGADGQLPYSRPVFDTAGNLYGTTTQGGGSPVCNVGTLNLGCGTIYELTPAPGGTWKETVLHAFTGGTDGTDPQAGLILDSIGNLYGTAAYAGDNNNGVVFSYTHRP